MNVPVDVIQKYIRRILIFLDWRRGQREAELNFNVFWPNNINAELQLTKKFGFGLDLGFAP